ncbi:biopolymer transport protein ExbD/TolR [Caballeronia fortuita]|uniref:Biopolymer transport protein ExbD/TolR n=1 Tax=Caballeronia fortuita TaxID=1777138 RepID=A0A158BRJ1_9BURK|nr:biopolymer transporter ExbD [Caballeronia fortuita]SAK72722.1 biopolymer transport protein ExbD/TolR [Caballeronia fortuita]
MAFGGLDKKSGGQPMADINMTPLIDVMLVLLVIFIITAPLFTHAIRLDLPKVASQPARETPQTITLSIDDADKLFWNDTPVTFDQMRARFADAARSAQKPELHLRASSATRYDVIAQVMGAAQQAGVERIGFVTQPAKPQAPVPAQ